MVRRPKPSKSDRHCLAYRSILCAFALVGSTVSFDVISRAAEITMGQTIVLEGQIEPGDFDKLRDDLLVWRSYNFASTPACGATYEEGCPGEIYLASPGGDVAEAIKIGHLVRALGWTTVAPTRYSAVGVEPSATGAELRQKEIDLYRLQNPKSNFMCASACFFIYVGGISRGAGPFFSAEPAMLGIHSPYIPAERLREMSGNQAMSTANLTKSIIAAYLQGMEVPTKYIDQMFSVPHDQIMWINDDDYDADFQGYIPSLRDWANAKCELTDVGKAAKEGIDRIPVAKRAQADWDFSKLLSDKEWNCEQQLKFELHKDAWQPWRKETLQNIVRMCATHQNTLAEELAAALSVAEPNQQSATVALKLAQTAALCADEHLREELIDDLLRNSQALKDYANGKSQPKSWSWSGVYSAIIESIKGVFADKSHEARIRELYKLREITIRVLAERGDAKAQRILGNLYYVGGSIIGEDRAEGMKWYGRAGAQGDLFAQEFYRDLSDKVFEKDHVWTDKEIMETDEWISRNCPGLC